MPRMGLCMLSVSLWPMLACDLQFSPGKHLSREKEAFETSSLLANFLLILPTSCLVQGPLWCFPVVPPLLGSCQGCMLLDLSATSLLPWKRTVTNTWMTNYRALPHISCACPRRVSRGQVPSLPYYQPGDGEGRHRPCRAVKGDLQEPATCLHHMAALCTLPALSSGIGAVELSEFGSVLLPHSSVWPWENNLILQWLQLLIYKVKIGLPWWLRW